MQALQAGETFPKQTVACVGGGNLVLGEPGGGHDWQMVVVYRGLHCPLCKKYLGKLEEIQGKYHGLGIDVVAVSGDPEDKAKVFVDEVGLSFPVGYGLSEAQMRALGVYVSDPRSPQETDRPFPEPGVFVVNGDGNLQIVDVSNAPFARPDLEALVGGLEFVRGNDYPIRGMRAA
ncbi:MAG: redoxin domain-containing protein [Pseudomonadota bacterium]